MRDYFKMIFFIVILGVLASSVLIGMDLLTKDRIEDNKLLEFQQTILSANNTEYTLTNINNLYDELVLTDHEKGIKDDLILYTHKDTLNVSFTFRGNGLWGEIYGMLTLKADFKTIVNITILEQEETPGLGAVVAEKAYLNNYVGKVFNPTINITSTPVLNSDVDQISGATGTSNAFQKILNDAYQEYYTVFKGGGILPEEEQLMRDILLAHNFNLDVDDRSITEIFTTSFRVHIKDDLKIYEDLSNGKLTYTFESADGFDKEGNIPGPVVGYLVLNVDFKTIVKIIVVEEHEYRGEELLRQENLDKAIGKKFPNIAFVENAVEDNEVDGVIKVTVTTNVFTSALNDAYNLYLTTFEKGA